MKSSKFGRLGTFFEVQLPKICSTLWRANGLEVKILKADGVGTFLEVQIAFKREDFDTLPRTWQAQEFVTVANPMVDSNRVRNDALRVASEGVSCFVMSMFEVSDAESVEGLHSTCQVHVTEVILCLDHFARRLLDFVRLG